MKKKAYWRRTKCISNMVSQHDMKVRHLIVKTNLHNQKLFGFMLLLRSYVCLGKLTLDLGQGKIYRVSQLVTFDLIYTTLSQWLYMHIKA